MDLIKIGAFLRELRKEQNISQAQLGEMLGVTNKTVSRWETGTYLPPVEMLQALSACYSVSINEILSGRRLEAEDYKAAAEKNLSAAIRDSAFTARERLNFFKKRWLKEHIALMLMMGAVLGGVIAAGILLRNWILISCAPLLLMFFHAIRNNLMMAYAEEHTYMENTSD